MNKSWRIALAYLFLLGCSPSNKIDLIEETFGIILPEDYIVLKDNSESVGLAGSDFEITVELKFQKRGFDELNHELQKINSLKLKNKYSKDLKNEFATLELDSVHRVLKFQFIHI